MADLKKLGERPAREAWLDVKDLSVSYGAIKALKGISLSVGRGEAVALIGANGAGKTSTLRAVSGMLKPAGGVITLHGENITGLKSHTLVPKGLAHAPEGRGIFPNLTVQENLDLGAYLRHDKDGIEADTKKCFGYFPRLAERKGQAAGSMSGGEQQMLAIARAMMSRPRLLLLDEPSLGLAPLITRDVFERLGEINRAEGLAMLVVEQNAGLALEIASRGYVLETGQIVIGGTADELALDEDVRKAYLGF